MDQPERHLLLLDKITLELINVTTMLSIFLRVLSTYVLLTFITTRI